MVRAVHKSNLLPIYILFVVVSFFVIISIACNTVFAANTSNIKTSAIIKPSLTLSIPTNTISMTLDPANHTFEEQDLTVGVSTNNFNGYKLYINTNGANLINTADSTKTIPNLSTSVSSANFSNCTTSNCTNKWGYRLTQDASSSSGNYGQFTSGSVVSQSNAPVNEKIATLGFAAKIDYTKPSGLYQLNLEFKALPIVTQYYMQELTTASGLASSVCTTNPTVVIDKRDEQPYLIQRLDDGKCWMLNNLNLDLTNATVVNRLRGTDETGANTNATAQALNYLKNGGGTASDRWAISGLTLSNWTTTPVLTFSEPLLNKAGTCSTSSSTPCTYNGNYTNNMVLSSLTPDQSNFGVGYGKIGIYYNYCAVSAGSYCYGEGTSSGTPSGNATMDICPANWRLPTSGTSGEYQTLCTAINGGACSTSGVDMDATATSSMQYKLSINLPGGYFSARINSQGQYARVWGGYLCG